MNENIIRSEMRLSMAFMMMRMDYEYIHIIELD